MKIRALTTDGTHRLRNTCVNKEVTLPINMISGTFQRTFQKRHYLRQWERKTVVF